MKKNIKNSILFILISFVSTIGYSQININKLSNKIKSELPSKKSENSSLLSSDEVVKGLKEALNKGVKKGAEKASSAGGFLKNDLIRIPFPGKEHCCSKFLSLFFYCPLVVLIIAFNCYSHQI